MPEFEKFLAASGGHTKANADEAKNYLVSVGFDPAQIDQWYDQWKGPDAGGSVPDNGPDAYPTAGGTTTGTTGGGAVTTAVAPPPALPPGTTTSSSSVNNGVTTVNTNTGAANTVTGDTFDPVAFNDLYQDALSDLPPPEIERVEAREGKATTFEVPYEQTSAGIMERLLSANSPYIQQARTRALNSMSDRGLLNSSLAAGAGEEAAIGQAFNVGSFDAGLYGDQRLENMRALNTMENANADRFLDAGKTNANAFNTLARDSYLSKLGAAGKAFDTSLDITKAKVETELGRGTKAFEFELGNLNAARDNAYKRGDMKLAAELDTQIDTARQTLAYEISNKTTARDNAYKQGDMKLAAELDKDIDAARQTLAYDLGSLAAARDDAIKRGQLELASKLETDMYTAKATLDQGFRAEMARLQSQLDVESRSTLMAIEHNYNQLGRYSATGSTMMVDLFRSINLVLTDPNMDQGNKESMIGKIVDNYDGIMEGLASMVVPAEA